MEVDDGQFVQPSVYGCMEIDGGRFVQPSVYGSMEIDGGRFILPSVYGCMEIDGGQFVLPSVYGCMEIDGGQFVLPSVKQTVKILREKTDLKMARTGGYRRSAVWRPCGVTPHAALQNKSVVCSGSRVTISTVMKLHGSENRVGINVKTIQRALAHIQIHITGTS